MEGMTVTAPDCGTGVAVITDFNVTCTYPDYWTPDHSSIDPNGGGIQAGGGRTPPATKGPKDSSKKCSDMEELRLADANSLAIPVAPSANRWDLFRVNLADGNSELWQFICGGRYCTGTVLNASPVYSICSN